MTLVFLTVIQNTSHKFCAIEHMRKDHIRPISKEEILKLVVAEHSWSVDNLFQFRDVKIVSSENIFRSRIIRGFFLYF